MATDNKAVTTYLPDDVEKSLTQYCLSKGLIRKDKSGKDKPSLGTAIIEILKDYFSIVEMEDSDLSQKLKDCFEDRVKDLVQDLVKKELSNYNLVAKEVMEVEQDLVNDSNQTKPLIDIPVSQKEILLQGKDLAKRFGVSSSKISEHKLNKVIFANWSKDNDPDGIEWDFKPKTIGKGVFYFPKKESLTNDVLSKLLKWIEDNLSF